MHNTHKNVKKTLSQFTTASLCKTQTNVSNYSTFVAITNYYALTYVKGIQQRCDLSVCLSICLSHSLDGCTVCSHQTAIGRGNIASPRYDTLLYFFNHFDHVSSVVIIMV